MCVLWDEPVRWEMFQSAKARSGLLGVLRGSYVEAAQADVQVFHSTQGLGLIVFILFSLFTVTTFFSTVILI